MSRITAVAANQSSILDTEMFNAQQVSKRFGSLPLASTGTLEVNRHYRFYTGGTVILPEITEALDGAKITISQLSGTTIVNHTDADANRTCSINAANNPSGGGITITFTAVYGGIAHLSTWYITAGSSEQTAVDTIYATGTCPQTVNTGYIRDTTTRDLALSPTFTGMGADQGKIWCSKSIIAPQTTWSEFFATLVFAANIRSTVVSSFGYRISQSYDDNGVPSHFTHTSQINFTIDWIRRTLVGNWGLIGGVHWSLMNAGYANNELAVTATDLYADNIGTNEFLVQHGSLGVAVPRMYININTKTITRFPVITGFNFYNIVINNYSQVFSTGNFLTM